MGKGKELEFPEGQGGPEGQGSAKRILMTGGSPLDDQKYSIIHREPRKIITVFIKKYYDEKR